ncbi:MAG: thiosulfohydrolase SoxB [Rhodobacteraceae bacterium]|nr:thiosulfohydrolase SoxB [Paracoccaceae bacterium]
MISRRHFLQASLAASALLGPAASGQWGRLAAQQRLSQGDLLDFDTFGNITLIHLTDLHAQTQPIWFREASVKLGAGAARGQPPHLVGADFLDHYGLEHTSAMAHALTHLEFEALGQAYGRMGGLDRIATVVNAIRADRADALLLDGGDTWHGSLPALRTGGQDMVTLMNALGVDAMTAHWEFTLGAERVDEIVSGLPFAFLGQNIFDTDWNEPVYEPYKLFERGGALVAVIGQAFPYTPIANPAWMFPDLSFGIREERMQAMVNEVRGQGADLVVVLSHNGFDVDRQMAARVQGIDVILTGHTHDALPEPLLVGETLLIASGSNGKFVTRLDLDVQGGRMTGFRHRLIPVFADAIAPDPEMAALVAAERAPFAEELAEVLGHTDSLLYRRGNFNGTWDDLICTALMEERDAEIALSPGVRWGPSLMPGDPITREDVFNVTAMTYGAAYRREMTGAEIHGAMEDIAENLFHPDPYFQQGGDMVRVGGLGYRIAVDKPMGERITDLTHLATGAPLDMGRAYTVAGWASVTQDTEGPQIWDVVSDHIRKQGRVHVPENKTIEVVTG